MRPHAHNLWMLPHPRPKRLIRQPLITSLRPCGWQILIRFLAFLEFAPLAPGCDLARRDVDDFEVVRACLGQLGDEHVFPPFPDGVGARPAADGVRVLESVEVNLDAAGSI